nr:probable ATP-dependent RNA helicase DHX35 [Ciona intestinalis]|eukprot:XP_026691480.1 probable ATP-dependent RNA helicase DHX35 [Ciona intestinalis]
MSRPRFWRPGDDQPNESVKQERAGSDDTVVFNNHADLSLMNQRKRLPIFQYRNHILYLLEKHNVLIIVGETGSGKSTQVPQYLVESGWTEKGKHGCLITQPRRVAAVTLATRVAEERGSLLGGEVGYGIRFDDCFDPRETVIKFVTDGVLLREMMSDPLLKKYNVVIVDEAHERSINTDMCMGLLKKIQRKRQDLRIIISSATISAEFFKDFFTIKNAGKSQDNVGVLSVEGRNYPIEVFYSSDPVPDYVKATVETVLQIHRHEGDGDILVFLTGQDEVRTAVRLLIDDLRSRGQDKKKYLKVLPFYSGLHEKEQFKVFERVSRNTRKVIVATNVAETSVTIEGVTFVVDCCFVKLKVYNPSSGIESLIVCPASQASLEQRAGRAGRCRNGKVYRLCPEKEAMSLEKTTPPEMQRSNLMSVILQLKALGVDNVLRFHFISPPPAQCMVRGLELLFALGALDQNGNLTSPLGVTMAEFPLNPMFVKMLLESEKFDCSSEIVTIVAMLQVRDVAIFPTNERGKAAMEHRKFAVAQGDHFTLLNIYDCFINEGNKTKKWCEKYYLNYKALKRAVKIRENLCKYMNRFKVAVQPAQSDISKIQRCIVSGFFANAARLHHDGSYRGLHNDVTLHIHPSSVLIAEKYPPKFLVFNEILETSKMFMRDVTLVEPDWLHELAPHFYEFGTQHEVYSKRIKLDV